MTCIGTGVESARELVTDAYIILNFEALYLPQGMVGRRYREMNCKLICLSLGSQLGKKKRLSNNS